MSEDEFDSVTDLDFIADDFDIPFLRELVERNEKVSINADHLTAWIEEDDERFFVLPCVDYIPLENDAGFQIRIVHAELDEDRKTRASVSTFLSGDEDGEYLVKLDEDGHIAEEEIILSNEEAREELPVFPPQSFNLPTPEARELARRVSDIVRRSYEKMDFPDP